MFPEERSLVKEMQGRPFVLLGVNTDEKLSRAKKSVKENKLNWRSFFDGKTRKITGPFKIRAYPTVMVINHRGEIVYPNLRGKKLMSELKRLVKEAEADGMEGQKTEPEMRVFRDSTGKHRIEAVVESLSKDRVKLRKKEGETVVMAVSKLSRSDQKYLRTVAVPELVEDELEAAAGEVRTFVDSTGKNKVRARFVELKDGKVTIRKEDGKLVTLPLDKLSEADREFVNDQ